MRRNNYSHQAYAIRLDERWETHPAVAPTPEAAQYEVWTGRLESRKLRLQTETVVNPRRCCSLGRIVALPDKFVPAPNSPVMPFIGTNP